MQHFFTAVLAALDRIFSLSSQVLETADDTTSDSETPFKIDPATFQLLIKTSNDFKTRIEDGGVTILKFLEPLFHGFPKYDSLPPVAILPETLDGLPVKTIGYRAFAGCAYASCCLPLQFLVLPPSVETIADQAFIACSNLKTFLVSSGVKKIGRGAFADCSSLTSFVVDPANPRFKAVDGVLFTADGKTLIAYPNDARRSEYQIPDGVEKIGGSAFAGSNFLRSIAIPASVREIGDGAFMNCAFLTSLRLDSQNASFKMVDDALFTADGKTLIALATDRPITEYQIPDGVEKIGGGAFAGSNFLRSIVIPASVEKIGDGAFCNCRSLRSISISSNLRKLELWAFIERQSLTSVALPNGLQTIGERTFSGCESLTSIAIPASVREIGESAFFFCESLTSISLPDGLQSIAQNAFALCESLTSVSLPDGLQTIGEGAFFFCKSLTSVAIPASVREIGRNAFLGCASDLTLYGAVGSVAEEYARENRLRFETR